MTTQITVRIADDAVAFLDQEVERTGRSRAATITRALRREARHQRAQRDAEIYATEGEDPEMEGFVKWATENASKMWADLD